MIFSTNDGSRIGHPLAKKKKEREREKGKKKESHLNLISYTKVNSKWTIDLNMKHKTVRE